MRVQRIALVIAGATALAACGMATSLPTGSTTSPTGAPTSAPTASPTFSPAPTSAPVGTPSTAPTSDSFEPLFVGFGDNQIPGGGTLGNGNAVLMLANGTITAPLPSGPIIDGDGTLAIDGLLGARMIGTDGQQSGSDGPVSIVAISADGALATLESNIVGSPSVIGRDDGQAWAWAEQTNSPNCGSSVGAALDVYIDEGSGAHMLARVSFGADVTEASLAAWTAAGIVVSGDNECGALGASTLATSPAILINPATGAATGLAGRIGTDCSFQDIADDGTIACSLGGASPGIRFIAPDGKQTDYSIPGMTSPSCINGGVALSADAMYAAVSISCPATATGTQLVLLDRASGHTLVVPGNDNLAPTLWTPEDVLIATDYFGERTFSVTPSGLVTLISAKYAAQTGVG